MPRVGLNRADVVAAAAELVDEIGFANLALDPLARRLNVRPPSLYKHVEGLAQLRHAIAVQAVTELDTTCRDAMHGLSGRDALLAFGSAFHEYIVAHPGRYAATIGEPYGGAEDPLFVASARVVESMAAVLRGYGVAEEDLQHAIRTLRCALHGFASLYTSDGFHWTGDPNVSFDWMIAFFDRGLRAGKPARE